MLPSKVPVARLRQRTVLSGPARALPYEGCSRLNLESSRTKDSLYWIKNAHDMGWVESIIIMRTEADCCAGVGQ